MADIARALRHRNYRLFFSGQTVSLIGTWITRVATSWLVYRLTDSGLLLGLVGFAGQFPVLLLAPVGGSVADEFSRHRIVLATQAASMFLALTLAFLTLAVPVSVLVAVLSSRLGDLITGKLPGRTSEKEITIYDSTGTAIQDAAAALAVYRKAKAKGFLALLALN